MADSTHDPRVDAYIGSLPDWQQDVCRRVRALAHAADPEVTETVKRTYRPYFVLRGNVCAPQAAKDHVNVFVYDPHVPDPAGVITSGHANKTGRTVAIYRGEAIDKEALVAVFRAIIAHNRAGALTSILLEGGVTVYPLCPPSPPRHPSMQYMLNPIVQCTRNHAMTPPTQLRF